MVNLKAKPFYLSDEQVHWVENSIAGMTLEEKLGQLFVILQAQPGFGEKQVEALLDKSHMGGLRWQNGGNKQQIYNQLTTFQKHTKIPLLIAANCDDGGNGAAPEGTFVATAVECGAGQGTENAYHVGLVAGREASALGANWMFNPVVDVYKNWRNTIVNTRAFSSDPDTVIANARAYIKGIKDANPNMACTAKHFPGDGVEELDQHLAMGVNSLSVEDWEASFGKVYRTLINEGLEAIMVGHIALPEMSRKLCPGIQDKDIKPATMAPELLTGLLREDMGFNGVVITDATHMVGYTATAKRKDAIPGAIIAGCDMILFANDIGEDIAYLKAAYDRGELTEERLSDALHRVLGMKAHLPLYEKQLRETETGIQNMLNAIQAGILTSSTKERLEALEGQKKDLEAKIAEEKLAKPVMKEEFVRFWLLHFRKLDLSQKEQRQALVDTFINAIYLYDDKMLITFNYKEGTETVSFGEATEAAAKEKSSDMDCLGAPKSHEESKGSPWDFCFYGAAGY